MLMAACCHNLKLSFNFCALEILSLHPHLLFSTGNWLKAEVHLRTGNKYMELPDCMSLTTKQLNLLRFAFKSIKRKVKEILDITLQLDK